MALKKKSPRETLKGASWVYAILAVLTVILGIVIALIPNINDVISEYISDENPLLSFEISLIVGALLDFWYFWLARRYADGKSNGTLFTVLLVLGVIGGCINMFVGPTKGQGSFNLIIDAVVLYFVYKIRSEKK